MPPQVTEALKLFGTLEGAGKTDNPTILGWARELGADIADIYKADSVPWCGLFLAVVMRRSGFAPPPHPLWALSWSSFGHVAEVPSLGDVLVFSRNGGGHVGLYVGADASAFHVLGGNQADKVCIARIARTRLYAARRPGYASPVAFPILPVQLAATGALSTAEE
jgi:uncharacterized protein (TIGR02594 family)